MRVLFCEIYTKALPPALRAMIARELVDTYGLAQWSVARALGIRQPLINHYLSGRRKRSRLFSNSSRSEEVVGYVKGVARLIAGGGVGSGPLFCRLRMFLRGNEDAPRGLDAAESFAHPEPYGAGGKTARCR